MCLQANQWSEQSGHLDAQVHEIIKITPKHAICGLLNKVIDKKFQLCLILKNVLLLDEKVPFRILKSSVWHFIYRIF